MIRTALLLPLSSLLTSALALSVVSGCGAEGIPQATHHYEMPGDAASSADSTPIRASEGSPMAAGSSIDVGVHDNATEIPSSKSSTVDRTDFHSDLPVPRESSHEVSKTEEPFVPRSGRQSGLLTAGSFDDVSAYNDYLSFLRRNTGRSGLCQLPIDVFSRQTIIKVMDGQGRPIGDARCLVSLPGIDQREQDPLLNLKTGSDGRATLFSGSAHQPVEQQQPLRLQVCPPGCHEPIVDELRHVESEWSVVLSDAQSTLPAQLDLALVIDTTGSMGDELEYLKTEIDSIAAAVNRMFPNVDQRYSLITYRDKGDEYVCRTFDFTGSLSDFRRLLDAQSAGGGGDFPESMDVALQSAVQLNWRTDNTARVMFLVGDAPPHAGGAPQAVAALKNLRQKGVRVFPVGASGVEKTAEILMRTASLLTMGQYLFLTDHSGVGNAHATPDVPQFAVERLDRLMIRMIASELAGKRLVPEEILAIERGESYSFSRPSSCPPSQPARFHTHPSSVVSCEAALSAYPDAFTSLCRWISRHALATLVGLASFAIVFDGLNRCCRR